MHYQLIPLYVLTAIFSLYTLWGVIQYYIDTRNNRNNG